MESRGFSLEKCLIILGTLICMICALTLIGIGTWMISDSGAFKLDTTDLVVPHVLPAIDLTTPFISVPFLFTGVILLLITLVGFVGACLENRILLITFFGILLAIDAMIIVGMVFAVSHKKEISGVAKRTLAYSLLNNYNPDDADKNSFVKLWNALQKYFQCCGVETGNLEIYSKTAWLRNNTETNSTVPRSCCIDDDNCDNENIHSNFQLYKTGCWNVLVELSEKYCSIAVTIVVLILLLLILSKIFVVYVLCTVKQRNY